MVIPLRLIAVPLLLATSIGCGSNPSDSSDAAVGDDQALAEVGDPNPALGNDADASGSGSPQTSPLMAPFEGEWKYDFEKTVEPLQGDGKSNETIERLRKMRTEQPFVFGRLFADLRFTGNVAVGTGTSGVEYRFFAMHEHDGKICGKAWHHEDRFDPGDMSKCYVRLMIEDDFLYLEVKMRDGYPDMNDPDLLNPELEGGSAEDCQADHAGAGWSEWTTTVYSRSQ